MSQTRVAPDPRRTARTDPAVASPAPVRWASLDVLRGLALAMMVLHHLLEWTGGNARRRLVGFDGFALTDLAAPAFALGLGAAAFLVGQQVRPAGERTLRWPRAARALRRYGEVLALGLAIDVAVGGGIDGGGVLLSLAALGVLVSLLSAAGATHPAAWWVVAACSVVAAVPVVDPGVDGVLGRLWAGSFSIVVYGTFAAAGAALAAGARGRGEAGLPLLRVAGLVVAVGSAAYLVVPDRLAPNGLWPPARHPGHLGFTMWGLAGSLVLWALVRAALPTSTLLGRGLARAGQRTLSFFGAHYVAKLVLQHTGLQGTLTSWRWTVAAVLAAVGATALAMAPRPTRTAAPIVRG